MNKLAELIPTLVEACRVVSILSAVEKERRRQGIRSLVGSLRLQGGFAPARDPLGRRCLRRAIRWVDGRMADGGNCYRRALLEIALDRGAADEPLFLGFHLDGETLSGHAWLDAPHYRSTFHFSVRL